MQRTKFPPVSTYPNYYQPFGGHMAFPPAGCVCFDRSFVDEKSGIRWLDNSFCAAHYCKKAPCARARVYKSSNEWQLECARLSELRKSM